MADAAHGGRAAVLPEVHRVSVALDPLLERSGHPKSGEGARGDRKGREKTLGKQRSASSTCPPACPCPARCCPARGHCHAGEERGAGLAQTLSGEGQGSAVKSTLQMEKWHMHELGCAELCTMVEGAWARFKPPLHWTFCCFLIYL